MINIKHLNKNSNIGLVLNEKFHKKNRWVSALTPYLVEKIIKKYDPIIITSQTDYLIHKRKFDYIISLEPGWAASKIRYDTNIKTKKLIFLSDPHSKTDWFEKYFFENKFDFVLSYYKNPFFYHFPDFPKKNFIHFPWAIPNEYLSKNRIKLNNSKVIIFGGSKSAAYDVRNWCRSQRGVENYELSGVENKILSDQEYFKWLSRFDAIIAAGSSDPKYDLVTPKYFEIASSGALLFGQECKDLKELGFSEDNSVIFNKKNFNEKIVRYKKDPRQFLKIREKGRKLIGSQHLISHRLHLIDQIVC